LRDSINCHYCEFVSVNGAFSWQHLEMELSISLSCLGLEKKMRKSVLSLVAGLVLVMGNTACAASELAGTAWRIEVVKDVAAAAGAEARFVVDAEGRVSTTVGCNQISGVANISGSKLTFGPLASTRMACESGLMDLEQKYEVALGATRSNRIEGAVLVLVDEMGVELVRLSKTA